MLFLNCVTVYIKGPDVNKHTHKIQLTKNLRLLLSGNVKPISFCSLTPAIQTFLSLNKLLHNNFVYYVPTCNVAAVDVNTLKIHYN